METKPAKQTRTRRTATPTAPAFTLTALVFHTKITFAAGTPVKGTLAQVSAALKVDPQFIAGPDFEFGKVVYHVPTAHLTPRADA
jgi:hypothetical protein